jgi:hypothetical protein
MSAASPTAKAAGGRLALSMSLLHAKAVFGVIIGAAETASLNRQNERAALLFDVAAAMAKAFYQDGLKETSVFGFFAERAQEERATLAEREAR